MIKPVAYANLSSEAEKFLNKDYQLMTPERIKALEKAKPEKYLSPYALTETVKKEFGKKLNVTV